MQRLRIRGKNKKFLTGHLLTDFANHKSKIDTQYGIVTRLQWCSLESARINRAGGSVGVTTRSGEYPYFEVAICEV